MQSLLTTSLCMQLSFLCRDKKKVGVREGLQYLLTVSLFSERHILCQTKAYTRPSPRVQWQWCRKSELQRTPLFSKHSYWGEELIIQSQGPRQPHLIAPQKKGQSFSYEEPPGSAPCQLRGHVQYKGLNGSLANRSIKSPRWECVRETCDKQQLRHHLSLEKKKRGMVWRGWRCLSRGAPRCQTYKRGVRMLSVRKHFHRRWKQFSFFFFLNLTKPFHFLSSRVGKWFNTLFE